MLFRIACLGVAAVLLVLESGCSDATGVTRGGEGLFDATPPTSCGNAVDGGITWTELYTDYFGPSGRATCALSENNCHGSFSQTGAIASGFVCAPPDGGASTQADCYTGMVNASSIVPPGGSQAPDDTVLISNLRRIPAPTNNGTMPKNSCFAFSDVDLERIRGWLKAGAQNN